MTGRSEHSSAPPPAAEPSGRARRGRAERQVLGLLAGYVHELSGRHAESRGRRDERQSEEPASSPPQGANQGPASTLRTAA